MNLQQAVNLYIKSRKDYYQAGTSNLSDQDYDTLEDFIKKQDPDHPALAKIGHEPSPIWEKGIHNIPMGSLNKCTTTEEFEKWGQKFLNDTFVLQYKLDGLSLSLDYEKGKFIQAITRGDGLKGEIISSNVRLMRGFKENISDFSGSIRAEILIFKNNFERINSILSEEKKYSNARNAAAGISRRLDGMYCQYLNIIYYDILKPLSEDEKINELEKMGLPTPFCKKGSLKDMINIFEKIKNSREQIPFNIDGVVIKICSLETQKKLGSLNNKPKFQIAWKFDPPGAITELLHVSWEIGRTGNITPVAHFKPVDIEGTTVRNSTLHNIAEIHKLKIGIGDIITIVKRGDIIPKIESVLEHHNKPIEIPTRCPCCNEILVNDDTRLMCVNDICDAKNFQRIMNFIKITKIEGFGGALAEKLYDIGKLRSISDIFSLKQEDIAGIEGWGERSARNILANLALLRHSLDPITFLASMGIPTLSTSTAEDLWAKYGSINKILGATIEDICTIKGYSTVSATKIVQGLRFWAPQIQAILGQIELQIVSSGGRLAGKSFCFTGEMSQPRSFFQGLVTKHGGKNDPTVTKTTTYLVCNENKGSSKSRKAEQCGVKIINEQQFLDLLGETTPKKPKLVTVSMFEEDKQENIFNNLKKGDESF